MRIPCNWIKVSGMTPTILAINPWIYDFAAYDLWARPLGLLYLADLLGRAGCRVTLVDCLDRLHPNSGAPVKQGALPGTGPWRREIVRAPEPLKGIPRRFARYGLPEEVFLRDVRSADPPDAVLVTSIMTYWYPGVTHAITLAKDIWPGVPVILGGIYATLCPSHAAYNTGADLVVSGPGEDRVIDLLNEISTHGSIVTDRSDTSWASLWPALDLYPKLDFAPLLTSRGCPYRCPYCASGILQPGFHQRPPQEVLAEIEDRRFRLGLRDFVFFDDALLVNAQDHILPVLESVVRRDLGIRFHAPNGLHVGLITQETADLMFAAGFKTLRLGLETPDPLRQAAWGGKVGPDDFEIALGHLERAGFDASEIGVYLLYGLPNQDPEDLVSAARYVRAAGARPYPAEFSPLPNTQLWPVAGAASPFDLENEPLYHNNTFFPCRGPDFSWERLHAAQKAART
ncbi:MAG: B12-binding domain-containing radical SAM protein [Thermodesulfobacteriota bacterium]